MIKDIKYIGLILLFYFSLALLITSCKAKFKFLDYNAEELKINNLIDNIEKNYVAFDNISVKFNVKFRKNNKKQVIQGLYRIKRDSLIWLSMGPAVGIEVMRAVLEKNGLKFINRFDKTYYDGSYQYLEKLVNINFKYQNLENILTNKLLFSQEDKETWQEYMSKNYLYNIEKGKYFLNRKEDLESLNNNSLVNSLEKVVVLPNVYKIEELVMKDEKHNRNISIRFAEFKRIKEDYFPQNIEIEIVEQNDTLHLDLKIKQINMDKKTKYPYKVPKKKYTRING